MDMNLKIRILISILLVSNLCVVDSQFPKSLCTCENVVKKPNSRIVNGTDVQPGDLPWVVSLMVIVPEDKYLLFQILNSRSICTGSIINQDHVLFAGHCFNVPKFLQQIKFYYLVAAGSTHNLKNYLKNEDNLRQARAVYRHTENDVAIAKLNEPFSFENIRPACFLDKQMSNFENELLAVGYGTTNANHTYGRRSVDGFNPNDSLKSVARTRIDIREGEFSPVKLQMIYLRQVTEFANMDDQMAEEMKTKFITARNEHGGTCFGDSGSPLHYFLNQKLYVVGITTGGEDFPVPNDTNDDNRLTCVPGARLYFTSVYNNLVWIKSIVQDNFCS